MRRAPEVAASQSAKSNAGGRYSMATLTLERNQRRGSGKVRQKCRKTVGASSPAATLQK